MKIFIPLFIVVLLLSISCAYAELGHVDANVKADPDIELSDVSDLTQFMRVCASNPDSSHLCEQVVDVEKLISECAKDPNSNGLCENIVGG